MPAVIWSRSIFVSSPAGCLCKVRYLTANDFICCRLYPPRGAGKVGGILSRHMHVGDVQVSGQADMERH